MIVPVIAFADYNASLEAFNSLFKPYERDAYSSLYDARPPEYNGLYYQNPVVESVAHIALRVSEDSIGGEEDAAPKRQRFDQKSFNTFQYNTQLKNGLRDEQQALTTLQDLFPDFTVEPGPKYKHDAILIDRTSGCEFRVEIKTCSRVHKTNQIFD